jgi:hypothetical protein
MAKSTVAKVSISLPPQLVKRVRKHVGARGISGFAARAMEHELERAQLGAFLQELESELGPVPDDLLAEARKAWHKS